MAITLAIDLHKLSKSINKALIGFAVIFFLAGYYISFYFHFITVPLILLNALNFIFLYVQRRHALLRNFGIMAQIRYMLESVGPEFRQYLFASDTEEKPFNRVERSEVYRKAYDVDSAFSFGSQSLFDSSEIKIRHSMFPLQPKQLEPYKVIFGEERGIKSTYALKHPIIISAMSYGSLGKVAIESLSKGANLAETLINTGEGGFPKYHLKGGADLIFQMGTAKFGVRNPDSSLNEDLLRELCQNKQVKMIEIKLSQGAKPGKGGLLPKEKISEEIAELRKVSRDKDVVSPSAHIECIDINSTIEFIKKVQDISGLPTGIKLCLGSAQEFEDLVTSMKIKDIFPDWIAVDGAEGGTGAAPRSFMDQVGVPIMPALFTVNEILCKHEVRDKTKIIAAGKLINSGKILTAMALGADACYSARGFMLSIGCIQALQCGKNTCPVGIATHDPSLQRGIDMEQKAKRVKNYVTNISHDFEQMLAATGCKTYKELNLSHLYIPENSDLYYLYNQTQNQ